MTEAYLGSNMTETTIDTGTNELLCVIRDRVAIITLNRPEARNAMSDNLTPALRNMIKACGENPEVGALLLTGALVSVRDHCRASRRRGRRGSRAGDGLRHADRRAIGFPLHWLSKGR